MEISKLLDLMEEIEQFYNKTSVLQEIEYANELGNSNKLQEYLTPEYGTVLGIVDNAEVYLAEFNDVNVYFLYTDSLLIYCITGKNIEDGFTVLKQLERINGPKGSGTALIYFLIHKLNLKFMIPKHDRLTYSGMSWLTSSIVRGGNILKFKTQDGSKPDPRQLWKEWEDSKNDYALGVTAIIIESKPGYIDARLFEDHSKSIIQPSYRFMGDDSWEDSNIFR
jgi:hypothetical protein